MNSRNSALRLGGNYLGEGETSFLVWAPRVRRIEVHLTGTRERLLELEPDDGGYHSGTLEGVQPGAKYFYRLDSDHERPDPASRFQPDTVHGPSQIIQPDFPWTDHAWFGIPLRDYIIYELHVGTFSGEGTFEGVVAYLQELKDLGVTALELMPVAQFPGSRNWGYDGVYPFAPQNSYGGPEGLKRLVNACHSAGLAVILDVVYNHLGPEGNYLREFGPYFTDRYQTPWGSALNFDGEYSDEVRRFFLENAIYWQCQFHIDALRLDAVHAIRDFSAYPFLKELADTCRAEAEARNRRFYLIAESDLNDPRLILPENLGGYGLDAQWVDDFHHCLHVLLTGEQHGYYEDFGGADLLRKVFRDGYAYTGQYSRHRRRRHGRKSRFLSARQMIVFSQNHDQIGNRMQGDRLSHLSDLEGLKLAAGTVLLSPFIPLLFMGEEYGEPAPFQYVTSHSDPELIQAVRHGRKEEFSAFAWQGQLPDPQAKTTFEHCVLNRELRESNDSHHRLYQFYRELIRSRKEIEALARAEKESLEVTVLAPHPILLVFYPGPEPVALFLAFSSEPVQLEFTLPKGRWTRLLDSADDQWGGPGVSSPEELDSPAQLHFQIAPRSLVLWQKNKS